MIDIARRFCQPILALAILLCLAPASPISAQEGFGPDDPIGFAGHGSIFTPDGKPIEPTLDFIEKAQSYYLEQLLSLAGPDAREKSTDLAGALKDQIDGLATAEPERPLRLLGQSIQLGHLAADVDAPSELRSHLTILYSELIRRVRETDADVELVDELTRFLEERMSPPSGGTVLLSTFDQSAAYISTCAANGVPIPPGWNEPGWQATGALTDAQEFISVSREARPYVYTDPTTSGTCIALPRFYDNGTGMGDGSGTGDIALLGIICLGTQTSKACFWDNSEPSPNLAMFNPSFDIGATEVVPLSQFNGGAGLLNAEGQVCTACHAGENSFVIHPGTALGLPALGSVDLFGDDWYDPLVHPDWPQNAGPTNILDGIPSPGDCTSCHQQGGTGGRFPLISTSTGGYCGILNNAIARTMPPGNPGDPTYAAHATALENMCGNAARPVLRVENVVLDYGEVELGFSFAKAVTVHNDGDGDLTVSVTLTNTADIAQWDETTEISDFVIEPGDPPLVLRQVYRPTALGNHAIGMQITASDTSAPVTNVSLIGEGMTPRPIDTALVLDRSGSMDDPAGDRRKIEAMRDSAMLYVDLLREDVGGTGTGDGLALIKYNNASSVYFPLTTIGAGTADGLANSELGSAAVSDVARLGPDGGTGIGGAMQMAADQLGTPDPDRSQVMVVLTDGKETTAPFIADAVADLLANHAQVQTFAVGLGFDIEPTKLQSITNMGTDGYHQVVGTLSDTSLFDLETFYFKIFASAAGMDLVTDPTHIVNLTSTTPVIIDRATVISSDRNATFLVMEDPMMRGLYSLEFISPEGEVIVPGSSIGGIAVQEQTRNTYRILRVVFPDVSQSDTYVGDWILRVRSTGQWTNTVGKNLQAESRFRYNGRAILPSQGTIPIGFAGAVSSDYKMRISVAADTYLPGAEIEMTAALTDRDWPATNGQVEVDIRDPSGVIRTAVLRDDGTGSDSTSGDAIWSGRYTQTVAPGTYRLLFRAVGTNERGELAPRLAERFITLAQPEPTPGGDPKPASGDGPGGGDTAGVAAYLIGNFDLRSDNRSSVTIMNPTGEMLQIVVALFDRDGRPMACTRDKIAANGLVEYDIERLRPDEKVGVIKVVALDLKRSRPAIGIVGNQVWHSDRGRSETSLHPVPRRVLAGDLDRIREACSF